MSTSNCPDCGKPLPAKSPYGLCPSCLLGLAQPAPAPAPVSGGAALSASDRSVALEEGVGLPAGRIGRYSLFEIIGEGGFGTVWMAEQLEPVRRQVALKVIKPGMDTRQVIARFEAERQALALMDHPNIARVLEAGATDAGRPFFVMELVRGLPITQFCNARRLSLRERLELLIPVCQAVQHAHQKGIIHRDLKPSNILVAEQDGRAVPKVIDFGVAKAIEDPLSDRTLFTRFHQFLGTPAYMSPEQACLGGLDIDTRTDIYSLGALLYELLIGEPPLETRPLRDASSQAILQKIRETEPMRPSIRLTTLSREDLTAVARQRREEPQRLARLVRGDLDWIVLKALEKDRTRRYQSANGLASDLRRFLENEPIAARPPSNLYRLQKLVRRNKLLFGAAAAVAAALVIGLITTSWQMILAKRHLAKVRLTAYASEMNVAQQALEAENNLERTAVLLKQQEPRSRREEDLRGFEWRHLWHAARDQAVRKLSEERVEALAFSPGGGLLVSGGRTVVGRETGTWNKVVELPTRASTLSFSPDGRWLATAAPALPVTVWETNTWEAVRSLRNAMPPAVFSPDGKWLVTGGTGTNGPEFNVWDTARWEQVASLPSTALLNWQHRHATSFSPDSRLLATPWMHMVQKRCGVRLWKVPSFELHAELNTDSLAVSAAGFLPDGRHFVTGTWEGQMAVWDLNRPDAYIQLEREHTANVTGFASAPGSPYFASVSTDGTVILWSASARTLAARLRGHMGGTWCVAMSPDGAWVASGNGGEGIVRVWRGQPPSSGPVLVENGTIAGFSADSRTVVLAPDETDPRWRLVREGEQRAVDVPSSPRMPFDFLSQPYDVTGNEPLGVLGRGEGTIELWNLATGKQVASWKHGTNEITAARFSPDGAIVAIGDASGAVTLWKTATRELLASIRPYESRIVLTFSFDGRYLAMAAQNSVVDPAKILVWEVQRREPALWLDNIGPVTDIAFSRDGRRLASCSMLAAEARLWELPSGRKVGDAFRSHVTGVTQVAFSDDGRTLATGSYDGKVKLWNLATRQEVATYRVTGVFRFLRFSPDGRTLAVTSWLFPGARVQFYHAPRLDEIAEKE